MLVPLPPLVRQRNLMMTFGWTIARSLIVKTAFCFTVIGIVFTPYSKSNCDREICVEKLVHFCKLTLIDAVMYEYMCISIYLRIKNMVQLVFFHVWCRKAVMIYLHSLDSLEAISYFSCFADCHVSLVDCLPCLCISNLPLYIYKSTIRCVSLKTQ